MTRSILFIFLSSCILGIQAQTAKLVEKFTPAAGSIDIAYSKYMLDNGLTILVHEDHSDPVVHLNVTYHVGSARETPGKSGFAHFFEHMLFQGSKHVADEEHFKLIKNYGGDVNGNTTRDRTVYIESFPSNFTETALWMEADRMGFLLEAFTKKKFEVQRATVKNEKDQNFNGPYGFVQEVKDKLLYPEDHPYSWSTIGYTDDLDRADSSDLRNFFLRWYGPNNACVIISGDVNTEQVVAWVQKYFGGIKQCPAVKKQRVPKLTLTENKFATYFDPNADVPLIWTSYVGVPTYHKDEAALDILMSLLGGSKTSPLQKAFVKREFAFGISASNNPMSGINHELAGEIAFIIQCYPFGDQTLNTTELLAKLQNQLDSFAITGFADEDLERIKRNIAASYKNGWENVSSKASLLSTQWYIGGDSIMNLEKDAKRYASVTKADIMRVYNTYIKGKFSSTIVIEPQEVKEGEKKKKYVSVNPNANRKNSIADLEYKGLTAKPVTDNFERAARPAPGPDKTPIVPVIYKKALANGLEIFGTQSTETPEILIQINMKGGHLLDNGKEFPMGTAALTAAILNEGTAKRTPEQLEKDLESLGASVSFNSSTTGTSMFINCSKDKVNEVLAIFDEMLFQPRWDAKEFKLLKKAVKQGAKGGLMNRSAGASNVWKHLVYGNTSRFGDYVGADDYDKITLDHCKAYFAKNYSPELCKLVIVGNISKDEALAKLNFLDKWQKKNVVIQKSTNSYKFETSQVFGVEYFDAEQSNLLIGFKSVPYDATGEFFKNNIMNFALGGNFNSRLNLNIREEKGWTYGIRSGFSSGFEDIPGVYTVGASVKANATDSAVVEIIKELEKYKTAGISQEEFEFTKKALLASEALEYESLGQKLFFIMNMAVRNLPENYIDKQMEVLKSLTRDEINALAKKNLNTDKLIIVVAGDKLLLAKRLDNMGYGKVQWMDKTGKGKVKIDKAGSHKKNYR